MNKLLNLYSVSVDGTTINGNGTVVSPIKIAGTRTSGKLLKADTNGLPIDSIVKELGTEININGGSVKLIQASLGMTDGITIYAPPGDAVDGYLCLSMLSADVGAIQVADNIGAKNLSLLPNGGKVGIGTTSPGAEMHTYKLSANAENRVESDLTTGVAQFKAVNNGDKNCTLGIRGNTAADYYTIKANDAYVLTDSASTRLMLQATSDVIFSPGQAIAMCLKTSGNIGIGTTTPTSKLDVAGDVELSGSLYQGDPTTDGSTRLRADGAGNVYHETRVSGSWILA